MYALTKMLFEVPLYFFKCYFRIKYLTDLECSYGRNNVGHHESASLRGKNFRLLVFKRSICSVRNANIYVLSCTEAMK